MREPIDGRCHCGTVTFRVVLNDGLASAMRCNCSYCRMRGAVAVTARLDDVTILSGAESLTLYEFNTRTAKHYFCRICGIHTFHQRRSNPGEYGVNLACLAGMSPFDLAEVTVTDGVHHTSDSEDGKKRVVGVLRFMAGKTSPCV
ncbi:GFA family protein [Sandarakinorhabdus glacialis]|nr:GFA family protein [Polymorphobacter glacialis]